MGQSESVTAAGSSDVGSPTSAQVAAGGLKEYGRSEYGGLLVNVTWVRLRTTNPIESTFATLRLRQRVTKGPGSRAAGIAMAFKLIESAQHRWRAVNAPHLAALARAGAQLKDGKLIERPEESAGDTRAA